MHDERQWAGRLGVIAASLGFLAVALGAFGAHGLEGWLHALPDGAKRLAWWKTGVEYHFWHALLVGLLAALAGRFEQRSLKLAAIVAVVGVVLFSGSLYVMTLTGIRALGMVTPLGGLGFLAAWALLARAALKSR